VTADSGNTRDDTKTYYTWGAQMELGTVATSYIPTLGSTVTRATDTITVANATYPYSATAGTCYVDWTALKGSPSGTEVLQFDDTTDNERIVFYNFTDETVWFEVIDGGASQGALLGDDGSASIPGGRLQMTGAWAANDLDASFNGGTLDTDGTATLPTMTRIFFCPSGTGSQPLFLYRLAYVPRQVETASGDLENWRYTA
jgi:hypothetical protein